MWKYVTEYGEIEEWRSRMLSLSYIQEIDNLFWKKEESVSTLNKALWRGDKNKLNKDKKDRSHTNKIDDLMIKKWNKLSLKEDANKRT